MKFNFYLDQHGLTHIDSMNLVLTENNGFDAKWSGIHFYPSRLGLTCIDPMNSIFTENDCFDLKWPKTYFLPRSTWFDLYWPDGLDFYGKRRLTREKYIFEFETFFSLNCFLGFLWIKIEIKITFLKILEDSKLGYYNCDSFCFFKKKLPKKRQIEYFLCVFLWFWCADIKNKKF
jgi:hypothetical protein